MKDHGNTGVTAGGHSVGRHTGILTLESTGAENMVSFAPHSTHLATADSSCP